MNADRLARTLVLLGVVAILGYGAWTLWQMKRNSPIPIPASAQDMVKQ